MEQITVYRAVKNPKMATIIWWSVVVVAIAFYLLGVLFDIKSRFTIFLGTYMIMIILNFWYPIFAANVKYIINESNHTFYAKGTGSKSVIEIGKISQLDIYLTKKGKIRYFLVRTPPFAYVSVNPYYKQEFLCHLLRLNPQIVLVEHHR